MSLYSSHTDDELLSMLRQHDHTAFAVLYERYWELLLGMAYNRLKDLSQAEDIVHDVFASLWKNRETVQIYSCKSWLATAVKYMIIRMMDRAALHEQYAREQRKQALSEDSLDDKIVQKQLASLLAAEINHLPEKCRIVFQLKRQGLTNPEIAEEMNTTVKTVENQVNRGIRSLKAALKHQLLSLFTLL